MESMVQLRFLSVALVYLEEKELVDINVERSVQAIT